MHETIRIDAISGRQRYRLLTSLVVPRPIGWISTVNEAGDRNLAPFSYFNAFSSTPILLGASIGQRRGEPKHTLANIRAAGEFVVNLADETHLEAMVETSGDWPEGTDEFVQAGLDATPSDVVRPPRVADAAAAFECRVWEEVSLGDYNTLVIGEVLVVHLAPRLEVDPETLHVDASSLRPVGRLGLDEYTLLGEIRHVPRPRTD